MPDTTSGPSVDEIQAQAEALDRLTPRLAELRAGADAFAGAMSRAFASAITSGRRFDDVLKSMVLQLSNLAVRLAIKPIEAGIDSGLRSLFSGLLSSAGGSSGGGSPGVTAAAGAVKPFAAGGVIAAPTYFPLATGGVGLAGEAGPEAILPLARGRDGRLGVAAGGAAAAAVTINITTPDADSFRRSEVYLAGQIARAVARGQRGL